jgi:hypothetical protein
MSDAKASKTQSTFSMTCTVSIDIAAPPSAIWARLTNAKDYPSWNTGVTSLTGEVAKGNKLVMKVPYSPDRDFTPKVLEMDTDKRMVWGDGMPGVFRGERIYTLTPTAAGKTEFKMTETFAGLLLPMIKGSLPDFVPTFDQYAQDLKRACEKG